MSSINRLNSRSPAPSSSTPAQAEAKPVATQAAPQAGVAAPSPSAFEGAPAAGSPPDANDSFECLMPTDIKGGTTGTTATRNASSDLAMCPPPQDVMA